MGKNRKVNVRVIKGKDNVSNLISKAANTTTIEDNKEGQLTGENGIISPPYPIKELQEIVEKSTILEQCVEAYRRNIVGFGAIPVYNEDSTVNDETPEMKREMQMLIDIIHYFNFDQSFEDVFGDAIEDREVTGNGYIEIIRDGQDYPSEGNRLDPAYIYVTKLSDFVDVEQNIGGQWIKRKRKFRKFVQDIGTKKVFYKEFGDPRTMDWRTGEYTDNIDEEFQANEILHLKIGTKAYGVPRWIGQVIHMMGARLAEELNYRYFTQGRHTPMAILLHNAELSPDSVQQLEDYAREVEGVNQSHKFLILEAEGLEEGILEDERKNAKVEMKSLADMLQQDALFLDYDEASRKKVQSAFRLPDIYVGRTVDFNRATADTARYITEEQVFEPERNSLEWIINHKLLPCWDIEHVKIEFSKPEISNAEEIVSVLKTGNELNALSPNDVRPIIGELIGVEFEALEGEEFNSPIISVPGRQAQIGTNILDSQQSLNNVQKAYENTELINLLKDMRDVIEDLSGNSG